MMRNAMTAAILRGIAKPGRGPLLYICKGVLVSASTVLIAACALGGTCKYVYFSWDLQRHGARDFLEVADKFAATPLDGVGLDLNGRNPDGSAVVCDYICQEPRWTKEAFAGQVDDYRKLVAKPGFKDSFFSSLRAPVKRVGWADDEGWKTIAHNMGIVAWMAHECGVKGLVIDHEDYYRQRQYEWQENDPPYEECRMLARRRGREIFGRVFGEHPSAILLSFWFLSEKPAYFTTSDPDSLRVASKDLWPDFVAGILDVLPSTGRFIDGNEFSYRYEHSALDFQVGIVNVRQSGVKLLPEELRTKYLSRVEQSFGQYLDMYVVPTNSYWSMGEEGGSRLEHFRRNLAAATGLASGYIWFWGERKPWIDWPVPLRIHRGVKYDEPWAKMLPGLDEMVTTCKAGDVGEWERFERMSIAGRLTNLLKKSQHFEVWQSKPGKKDKPFDPGTFSQTDGVYTAESVTSGCFLHKIRGVEVGERYACVLRAKGVRPSAQAVWIRGNRQIPGMPRPQAIFGNPDPDGWRVGRFLMTVPAKVDGIEIQMGVRQEKGERTVFDNVKVCRLWPDARD